MTVPCVFYIWHTLHPSTLFSTSSYECKFSFLILPTIFPSIWLTWEALWVPRSSGKSQKKQIRQLIVTLSSFHRRETVALTTVQAFKSTRDPPLTQRVFVCVFVYVCWRGTDRNLGVCCCHNEMSIFMTCCLLSSVCELFQTSASVICIVARGPLWSAWKVMWIK